MCFNRLSYIKLISLVMVISVFAVGCKTTGDYVDEQSQYGQSGVIIGETEEIPENMCPYCIMFGDQLYVTWCEEVSRNLLENVEEVGVIALSIPGNRLPTENLQTNAEKLVNKSIWKCDGLLFIETDQEDVFWSLHEYQDG